jgi:ElaB/YqjD/DUF883 family membrane-anchored ribosome-binding protein
MEDSMDGKEFKHESYGLIGISNTQCSGGRSLFGSSIKHDRTICLRIRRASVERDLKQEWYHGEERLIEIDLSASQFTQFITSPNRGDGVPCTLRYVDGKRMDDPPYRGQNEIFNRELKEDFSKAMTDADSLINDADEMLLSKGAMKVGDKKKLHVKLRSLVQHIKANMPFLHSQFTRSMDKTVNAAKAEIEEFYTSTIMKMGKKALENGHVPEKPMIENK